MRVPAISIRIVTAWLLCLLAVLPESTLAANLRVLLLLSDRSAPYQQYAGALNQELAAGKLAVTLLDAPTGPPPDLIVAVGMKATELAIAQFDVPVMSVMIPKQGFEALRIRHSSAGRAKPLSAIYIEHPWDRQFDFIGAALPAVKRVALLYSPQAEIDPAALRAVAAKRGLELAATPVSKNGSLFADLERALGDSNLLLALPDREVYNSNTIRNILLSSYRHQVPLAGFSQAYLNAGALCALYSTPEQFASQTSMAISAFIKTAKLPEARYPASFSIGLNYQVARSLGIVLDSPEAVRARMDTAGEGIQ